MDSEDSVADRQPGTLAQEPSERRPAAAASAAGVDPHTGPLGRTDGTPSGPARRSRLVAPAAPPAATVERADAHADAGLPPGRYFNRELSWLDFNSRVLALAEDSSLPVLERVKFLAIHAANLDEFYMVRVAGLGRRAEAGLAVRSADGLTPREQLALIGREAQATATAHARTFLDEVVPALDAGGIRLTTWDALDPDTRKDLSEYFHERIFPVLTPLAVDPAHPFPYISGLSLNLAVTVGSPSGAGEHFARVKVPRNVDRFVPVHTPRAVDSERSGHPRDGGPSGRAGVSGAAVPLASASGTPTIASRAGALPDGRREGPDGSAAADRPTGHDTMTFLPVEELIAAHLDSLFHGMEVVEHHAFRVTRNADVEVAEDRDEDLLQALERELARRRFGAPVRLEVAQDMSEHMLELLLRELDVDPADVVRVPGLLDLTGLWQLHALDRPDLKYAPFVPSTPPQFGERETAKNVFTALRHSDVLVHHPYDSFSTSVQRFIEQAADDPHVLAIKQTLYRTSGDSPIVDALVDAAEAGKQVVALVEIKARFDEQANIRWARKLEQAGVHVVYGIVGLKTHCKTCLVVRREGAAIRRYCHIGTGNYNPKTARQYEDMGLFTADPDIGADLTDLFNSLTGYSRVSGYRNLLVSPHGIRRGIVDRIDGEIAAARAGRDAGIRLKVNALVDEQIIDALYRASQAGVRVDVLVRGICCLKPGFPGLSANIRVRSVLGRFLEHSRIAHFADVDEYWIGSADMMHRNLDRRVEVMVRIADPGFVGELSTVFDLAFAPDTRCWTLDADGGWSAEPSERTRVRDYQETLLAAGRGTGPG